MLPGPQVRTRDLWKCSYTTKTRTLSFAFFIFFSSFVSSFPPYPVACASSSEEQRGGCHPPGAGISLSGDGQKRGHWECRRTFLPQPILRIPLFRGTCSSSGNSDSFVGSKLRRDYITHEFDSSENLPNSSHRCKFRVCFVGSKWCWRVWA